MRRDRYIYSGETSFRLLALIIIAVILAVAACMALGAMAAAVQVQCGAAGIDYGESLRVIPWPAAWGCA